MSAVSCYDPLLQFSMFQITLICPAVVTLIQFLCNFWLNLSLLSRMSYNVSNISELFQTWESNNQDVVKEIKQVIYEMYDEGNKNINRTEKIAACGILSL